MNKIYFFAATFFIGLLQAQEAVEPALSEEQLLSLLQQEAAEPQESSLSVSSDESDSGNWYEKLQWWRKAKPAYKEVKRGVKQLKELEKELTAQKSTIQKEVDAFYASVRIQPQETQEHIQKALDELKTAIESMEVVTQEERAKKVELADRQKTLEGLRADLEAFTSVVTRVGEALSSVAPEQLKKAEQYQARALESFEHIENVLDDQKAKRFYETIENSGENIQALITYLQGALRTFVNQSVAHSKELMARIKNTLDELEKQGISLRTLTEEEKQLEIKRQKELEAQRAQKEAQKKAAEQRSKMSWWQRFWESISSFFDSLWSSIKGLFGGATSQKAPQQKDLRKPGTERKI